jgi:hypothetical protein
VLLAAAFHNPVLPYGDGVDSIFPAFPWFQHLEVFTVVRKIGLVLVLMTMAGAASASDHDSDRDSDRNSGSCFQILWFTFCPKPNPVPVRAPEIDPASAMAGLTLLAGSLAVLRGRRRKVIPKE